MGEQNLEYLKKDDNPKTWDEVIKHFKWDVKNSKDGTIEIRKVKIK